MYITLQTPYFVKIGRHLSSLRVFCFLLFFFAIVVGIHRLIASRLLLEHLAAFCVCLVCFTVGKRRITTVPPPHHRTSCHQKKFPHAQPSGNSLTFAFSIVDPSSTVAILHTSAIHHPQHD